MRYNTHMSHLESLVTYGKEALNEIQYKLDNFFNDTINVSTKIDGSPAVILWSYFEGYPENSICLKSFVNNANNVLSSPEDIETKYGDRPEMCDKLLACLKLAKSIPTGEAWQGDCLFTSNSLHMLNILGKEYLTFQPNKVIYAIDCDKPTYNKIARSAFGICFHTIYRGNLEHKTQSFKIDINRLSNIPEDFYIMTPLLDKPKNSSEVIKPLYNKFINLKKQLENKPAYETLVNNPMFIKYWSLFENKYISDKQSTTLDLSTFEADLHNFISERLQKDYDKKLTTLKTDKGKEKAKTVFEQSLIDLDNLLDNNKDLLKIMVECFNVVAEIKMQLIKLFPDRGEFDTFFNSKSKGYIPNSGEGLAMSDDDGNIVKLIDRSEFSAANRSDDYRRGFEEDLNEKLGKPEKTAVVAFGRFNPPTIGHKKLVQLVATQAMKHNADPLLFLSHSCDKKKNPLSYDKKLSYCKEAFPEVNIVNSSAKTLVNVLEELNDEYTDIIYVCGSDRLQGDYSTDKVLLAYNNKPDKSGKINYAYNSINFVSAGNRSEDSEDALETVSASKARELVKNNDFASFEVIVPFETQRAKELFKDVQKGLGIDSLAEDLESQNITEVRHHVADILRQNPNVFIVEERKNIRHPSQLLRIRFDLNNQEKTLQEVTDTLQDLPIENYKYIGYGYHPGASGQFNSFEITIDDISYFITVSTKINKELTPVKLMSNISGKIIDFNLMPSKITYSKDKEVESLLQNLAIESINKVQCKQLSSLSDNLLDGASNDIHFEFKSEYIADKVASLGSEKFKLIKNGLEVDFAEVYGATALARLICYCLEADTYIQYPSKSNEKLIDYTIITSKGSNLRVSAKTKSGARPSSLSMFESIRTLLNNGYQSPDLAPGINFSSWFIKEYLSKGVDEGYSFLAEVMIDIAKGNGPKWASELDYHQEFKTIAKCISNKVNLNKCLLLREACNSILNSYGEQNIREPSQLYEGHLDKYIIRCLGTVLVALINNSELIDQVNLLFRLSYGSLIQVYAFPDFEKGEFKFTAKWVNNGDHKYHFKYNIGLDTQSRTFKNNKLAIVVK